MVKGLLEIRENSMLQRTFLNKSKFCPIKDDAYFDSAFYEFFLNAPQSKKVTFAEKTLVTKELYVEFKERVRKGMEGHELFGLSKSYEKASLKKAYLKYS